MTIYISVFLSLLIIATLIHQHKIKKEIQKTKEETEKTNKKIEDLLTKSINNKEHCGYVSADLPKQIVNLQNKLSEFTTLLFKIIDEHTKNNSDFINKSLNKTLCKQNPLPLTSRRAMASGCALRAMKSFMCALPRWMRKRCAAWPARRIAPLPPWPASCWAWACAPIPVAPPARCRGVCTGDRHEYKRQ